MNWWNKIPTAPSEDSRARVRNRQAQLTKPLGSLGQLESLVEQLGACQRKEFPRIQRVYVRVFAGDHGVAEEGVSAFPQSVTVQMIQNFAAGGAAITALARQWKADFGVVNLGTLEAVPDLDGVLNVQLAQGCANICKAAAMSDLQLEKALAVGAAQVQEGCDLFVGGEMGIGNTTAASALCSAYLGLTTEQSVGRGTGVDEAGLKRKKDAVSRALALHLNYCDAPQETLRRLGGFEIAALAGAYIQCALAQVPILVDGFISTAAAYAACEMNPGVRDWMFFSHRSSEVGHSALLSALSAEPLLDLGLRLGEGSGAMIALPLLRDACVLHSDMATFEEAGVSGESSE